MMYLKLLLHRLSARPSPSIPLRLLLIIPFVIQITIITGIVGYLSFKQGQKSINELAQKLQEEAGERIAQNLDHYLTLPTQIVETTSASIEQGILNPLDLKAAGTYFWKYSQVFQNFSFFGYYLSDRTGAGAGRWYPHYPGIVITQHPGGGLLDYTYAVDGSGQLTRLLNKDIYDPLIEPWYQDTITLGKASWTRIYIDQNYDSYIAVSFNKPFNIPNSTKLGVLSLDLLLTDIADYLHRVNISPSAKIVIVERDGQIVASSSNWPVVKKEYSQVKRLHLSQYGEPYYQKMAQALGRQFGDLGTIHNSQRLEFYADQEKQFLYIKPWRDTYGLDWLLMIAFPESDFLAQVHQNNRQTLLLCTMAVLLTILINIIIARWLTKPIQQLSQQAADIAQGEFHTRIQIGHGIQELSVLSASFNEMASQLENSFETLEENVNRRTKQLNQTKQLLEATNQKLTQSLREKEILIKEIHHRVKNNLLIVSSLLNWQVEGIQAPGILQIFTDSQKRINSMALIHEKLYRSTDLVHIDFGDYLQTLASQLSDSFRDNQNLIQFHYCIAPILLNVETATPCGLIVNELILNALEHAFSTVHEGNLFLTLKKDVSGEISLIVEDDGVGFPEQFDFRATESLGWQLICLLAEQIEGNIEVTSSKGARIVLTFRELNYKKRL